MSGHPMTIEAVAERLSEERLREIQESLSLYPAELNAIVSELLSRRTPASGAGVVDERPQCCMCGKLDLSTVEGDGGKECELADGRWVCSQDCYDRAVSPPPDRDAALEEALADKRRMDWLVSQDVTVRTPLVYGSRANFVAQVVSDEEDAEQRTTLREQVDAALKTKDQP